MTMARIAKSLDQLRDEIDARAPGRSKASDGWIGDDAHADRPSDHNPNAKGVVCAFDATHDPAHGADMAVISEHIRTHPPLAAKYIIFNRRIAERSNGWRWKNYGGSNPHTKHMHVSVGRGADGSSTGPYDDTSAWGISSAATTGGADVIGIKRGDTGDKVEALQAMLNRAGHRVTVDSEYGAKTAAALLACRKAMGSSAKDGNTVTGYAYDQVHAAVLRAEIAKAIADGGGPAAGKYTFTGVGTLAPE